MSIARELYHNGMFSNQLEVIHRIITVLGLVQNTSEAELFNIRQLTRIVFDFDEIWGTRRLSDLCRYFVTYARRSFDEASPIEESINVVKVLTIHQAKELEFDMKDL